ncbi:MAG: CheR family methyltransferase [Acetivibrionales bacterium]|jgi:chemotaxis protein methyltransferase CheR
MDCFNDYELFKSKFYNLSNIDLNLYKEKQMKRRITSLIEKYGLTTYCSFLEEMKKNIELYKLFINYLTINVSEFYRNPNQWVLFENRILSGVFNNKNLSDLRIWSSACSTGDEPYTIVMILNKHLPLEKIRVLATDIDLEAINKAKVGIYPSRSLKELPKEYLDKHFTKVDNDSYQISEKVRKCVSFKQLNLLEDPYPMGLDIIVCRNVLIYFTEDAKNNIMKKFSESLKSKGVLFIGSTEQIMNYQSFNMKSIETFFYQKAEG